jgi:hypothetical protein
MTPNFFSELGLHPESHFMKASMRRINILALSLFTFIVSGREGK